jgi:feruloyl esterase
MRNYISVFIILAVIVTIGLGGVRISVPANLDESGRIARCESLTELKLPNSTITLAETVAAGTFIPPSRSNRRPITDQAMRRYVALPEFCRVSAVLSPAPHSEIQVEVWMPLNTWNGKYLGVGNGAFTGSIGYRSMLTALERGYATSSTDTGHEGNTASFGLEHPEKIVDFGWRSVHEMTVVAKGVITAYYDQPAEYSYWYGCSAGGRQAMKEAQRFPKDYDGIIAGAPGLDWTGRAASALRLEKYLGPNERARLLEEDRKLVHTAVLATCDAVDGVTDGVIGSPENCKFDPNVLACSGDQSSSCLNVEQVNTVRQLYSSSVNPQTNRPIPGLFPGSELGWTDLGWTRSARTTGLEQFKYLVFKDPEWTVDSFNFESDIVLAEDGDDGTLNALNPNLNPFIQSGGKLIQYHGWSDPQISPGISPQYYWRVVGALGGRDVIHDNYRLFMAPGMGHCSGGEGPDKFNMIAALERWVELGEPPDRIIASRIRPGESDLTRPLCPYPQVASYIGSGSTNNADNFNCALPTNSQ